MWILGCLLKHQEVQKSLQLHLKICSQVFCCRTRTLTLVVEAARVHSLLLRTQRVHVKVSEAKTRLGDLIRRPLTFRIILLWSTLIGEQTSRSVTRMCRTRTLCVQSSITENSESDAMSHRCFYTEASVVETVDLGISIFLVRGHLNCWYNSPDTVVFLQAFSSKQRTPTDRWKISAVGPNPTVSLTVLVGCERI